MTMSPNGQPISERRHHPKCGNLSVPDVLYRCERCGRDMDWCGCRYYCKHCESDSRMTDSLRTRIAEVLYTRAMSRLAWSRAWDGLQPEVQQMWLEDADAVIHALGPLGRYEYAVATSDREFIYMYSDERSELDDLPLHPGEQIVRRYATNWEPDNA